MKFFLTFFDAIQNRPSYKFFLNLFFIKNNQYFSLKQLNYIHIFYNLTNYLKLKFFKFNYMYYVNFIFYFLVINFVFQGIVLFF